MNTYEQYGTQQGEQRGEEREGRLARNIERQTAKLPSDIFLWAAGAAIVGSLAFQVMGMAGRSRGRFARMQSHREITRAPLATFIGQWAPTFLLLGIYNKIVKVAGSDRFSR